MSMNLKRGFALIRASLLDSLQFRLALLFTIIGNLLYLLLIYNLWKAIYTSCGSDVVNGMSFSDTMIYLVFASAVFNFIEMWIVWNMGRDIQSGQIVVDLLRPMSYRNWKFMSGVGETIVKFFTTFMPTAIVVYFVSHGAIHLGLNVVFFIVSLGFSLLISYYLSFITGTICLYTESIWGVNIMKEVIVGLLSGATIPLVFFPAGLKKVALVLPFQTIVNSPMEVLLHPEYSVNQSLWVLGVQFVWAVALLLLCEGFFRLSLRRITVNGG